MKLAVCICTYQRPDGLRRLLSALSPLAKQHPFEVFVVDNHLGAEGLDAIHSIEPSELAYPIHAERSSAAGISHARNQVLQMAVQNGSQFAALIDDDEWPSDNWLSELLRVQALDNADAVGGPTQAVFEQTVSKNLEQSVYYGADLGLPDNSPCTLQACGNVLLKLSALEQLERPLFDPDLGHSGGEDLAFFMRLQAIGFTMRWAAQALVFETVPAERSNTLWLKRRIALISNTRVHIMRKLQPSPIATSIRLAKTTVLAVQACLLSAIAVINPKVQYHALVARAKLHGKTQAHLGRRLERGENH